MSPLPPVHVVAAVLTNADGAVLVQQRAPGSHQGGLWEFPGGKLEHGESRWSGLVRELSEELGIQALEGRPLITVCHDYGERQVLLDVWKLQRWRGQPNAEEGQPLRWVAPTSLSGLALPAADEPVVRALCLPERYLITPEPPPDRDPWIHGLQRALDAGVPLIQLRATTLNARAYRQLAIDVLQRARASGGGTRILLNAEPALALELGAHGVHLNARRLAASPSRPLPRELLVAASCHDARSLAMAARADVDFAVLSPVNRTASHPGAPGMGWQAFAGLCAQSRVPVFALGGVSARDLAVAWEAGAQGIAAIRALWPSGPSAPAGN